MSLFLMTMNPAAVAIAVMETINLHNKEKFHHKKLHQNIKLN